MIDCYSIKPIDAPTLRKALEETGTIVVVEDHGRRRDRRRGAGRVAATGPLSGRVMKLGVTEMPGSGSPTELRAWAGIDEASIVERVRAALAVGQPVEVAVRTPPSANAMISSGGTGRLNR